MMSLEISYFAGTGTPDPIYRGWLSSEQRTLSGSAASSGATPAGARVVRIEALSNARIRYGAGAVATNDGASIYLASGKHIDVEAVPGAVVSGITAS